MNRPLTVATLTALAILTVACSDDSARRKDERTVNEQQQVYSQTQPVPRFDFSQDRDTLIQIYELKNEARQTYTVVTSLGNGEVVFACPSRGYALPADMQLTNPLQVTGSNGAVVEQAEPNGLYSSKNTDATYVLCVRDNGDVVPVYTELKVTTFPFAVTVGEDGTVSEVEGSPSAGGTIDLDRTPDPAPSE